MPKYWAVLQLSGNSLTQNHFKSIHRYEETTTIQNDLFVLVCLGTAVTIDFDVLIETNDKTNTKLSDYFQLILCCSNIWRMRRLSFDLQTACITASNVIFEVQWMQKEVCSRSYYGVNRTAFRIWVYREWSFDARTWYNNHSRTPLMNSLQDT